MDISSILELITCPLSGKFFCNPVIAGDNEIYEALELNNWFKKNGNTSPKDNHEIEKSMILVHPLKAFICELVDKNPNLKKNVYPNDTLPNIYCFNRSKILGYIYSHEWEKLYDYDDFMLSDIDHYELENMIKKTDYRLFNHIIKNSKDKNDQLGDYGWKLINYVAKYGNKNVLEYLINLGVDIDNQCPSDKWTPLHQAANSRLYDNVKLLVDSGADVNLKNDYGETSFSYICKYCDSETIKYCLGKIDHLEDKDSCRSRIGIRSASLELNELIDTK